MKLYIDLLRDARPKRGVGDAILLLGLLALGAGTAVELTLQERIDSVHRLKAENVRERELASTREDDLARAAFREETANQRQRDEYRRTFPLNEVLKAVEMIKGGIVRNVAVNVDTGFVRLELGGDSVESITDAVYTLQEALPESRVTLRRQAVEEKRVTGTIEVRDLKVTEGR